MSPAALVQLPCRNEPVRVDVCPAPPCTLPVGCDRLCPRACVLPPASRCRCCSLARPAPLAERAPGPPDPGVLDTSVHCPESGSQLLAAWFLMQTCCSDVMCAPHPPPRPIQADQAHETAAGGERGETLHQSPADPPRNDDQGQRLRREGAASHVPSTRGFCWVGAGLEIPLSSGLSTEGLTSFLNC